MSHYPKHPDITCTGPEAAASLSRLHALCFPKAPWTMDSCKETLEIPGTFLLLHPEGFLLLRMSGPEGEILSIGVAPTARGHGLGHHLVATALEKAREHNARTLLLEVSEKNPEALALYKKNGFLEISRRPKYYTRQGNGEDAIVMQKNL
ncbi:MAG: ribosomal-protein-alanine N-acetyltransferase [Alphaproteobacteria bacterium GWF2_58_20]|nr:MAG: ribosomal-protein-alanine N-acetyltransferase [Alphaproteobacteria bacterium GWF2_58_20]